MEVRIYYTRIAGNYYLAITKGAITTSVKITQQDANEISDKMDIKISTI